MKTNLSVAANLAYTQSIGMLETPRTCHMCSQQATVWKYALAKPNIKNISTVNKTSRVALCSDHAAIQNTVVAQIVPKPTYKLEMFGYTPKDIRQRKVYPLSRGLPSGNSLARRKHARKHVKTDLHSIVVKQMTGW